MTAIAELVKDVVVGEPLEAAALSVFPLFQAKGKPLPRQFLSVEEGLKQGSVAVGEITAGASVPEIEVDNRSELDLLIIEGEELVGAMQNRILNLTVCLPARQRTKVPVSCVEAGRWHHTSAHFAPGEYAPPSIRKITSDSVTKMLKAEGVARSDQAKVWDEVDKVLCCYEAPSASRALSDAYKATGRKLKKMLEDIRLPENASGMVIAIGGKVVGAELFAAPELLAKYAPRLLRAAALEALGPRATKERPTADSARALLAGLAEIKDEPHPSPGLGTQHRLEGAACIGSALEVDGALIHLGLSTN